MEQATSEQFSNRPPSVSHEDAVAIGAKGLLTKHRIEALSDGVFAIVMTLLVLELKVPEIERHATASELLHALRPLVPVFFSFFITFLLSGLFWATQQSVLNAARASDKLFTVLSLSTLMFVSLLPFSTAMLGHYISNKLAVSVYFANQFAIALTLSILWLRLERMNEVAEHAHGFRTRIRLRLYGMTLAGFSASLLAFVDPHAGFYSFGLIMVLTRGLQRRMKLA